MDTKYKLLIAVIVITIFFAMGYMLKTQHDMIITLQHNSDVQTYLKDNITSINASLVTKDEFKKRMDETDLNLSVINNDLTQTGYTLQAIMVATNTTQGSQGTSGGGKIPIQTSDTSSTASTGQVSGQTLTQQCDYYGNCSNISFIDLFENTKDSQIPIGNVKFNPTLQKPWEYKVYPRTYKTSLVISQNAAGEKKAYVKMSIVPNDGKNKEFSLPETQVAYTEQMPEAQFSLWNPRVMFGLNAGISGSQFSIGPNLQMFTSSYGKLKYRPDWFIGGIGGGYDISNSKFNIMISPFMYKITSDSSLFQNINIGPSIGINQSGNFSAFANIMLSL